MSEVFGLTREYRDRLFKFIFGNSDNREWTLSLYNAINGSHYTNSSDITLNTIDDVVYMGMKNDVSFLIDSTMNLYEQQSTFNPNMPMRFLIYAGLLYSKYIEQSTTYHIYSTKQQYAPTPKCVCFYNGTADKGDRTILKLSDAFDGRAKPDIELYVTMININYGHNKELMEKCRPLYEYSVFVENVRQYQETAPTLSDAIDMALNDLPDNSVIKPLLLANRAEVTNMCITEYNEARTMADQRDEGYAEGRAEGLAVGIAEGRAEGIAETKAETARNFLNMGFSVEQVAQGTGLSVETIMQIQ